MSQTETFTHHMIDDLPQQDEAMEALRNALPFLCRRVIVSEDGKTMTFTREGSKWATSVEDMIRRTVVLQNLPLVVERDTWRDQFHWVHQDQIIVRYTGL